MIKRKLIYPALGLTGLMFSTIAGAAGLVIPIEGIEVNVIGLAGGVVPDYYGSSNYEGGVGPYGRYQFEGSERYVVLLGPLAQLNLLNDENWRFGPVIKYRFSRDNSVQNNTVKQLNEVDGAIEGGAFLEYKLPLSRTPLHQVVFGGDVEGGKNGTETHLHAMYWQPLSTTLIGNIGVGMTYGNGKFVKNYFGITSAHDIALYPSLGGEPYDTSSGIVGWNIPFGISKMVSDKWLVSVGGRYERLVNDAKDSPVVDQSGDANQWIGGVGIAYMFK